MISVLEMYYRYYSTDSLSQGIADEVNETVVNATGEVVIGFAWPSLPSSFLRDVCENISNVIVILVTAIVGYKCAKLRLSRTAAHAFYCLVGMVLFVTQALLCTHPALHTAFGMIGVLIGFLGVGVQILHLRANNQKHFATNHSTFGLATCFLLLATLISGLYPTCQPLPRMSEISALFVHRLCGLLSFVLVMTSLIFSFNSGFMHCNWDYRSITCFKSWVLLAMFLASSTQLLTLIATILIILPFNIFEGKSKLK